MKKEGKHHLPPPEPINHLIPDWEEAPFEFKLTPIKILFMSGFSFCLLVLLGSFLVLTFLNPQIILPIVGFLMVIGVCMGGFYFWVSYFVNKDLHK